MAAETQARFDLTSANAENPYAVRSRAEIVQLLKGLIQGKDLVTAFYSHSNDDFVLTSVLEVGEDRLVLDYGSVEARNQALARSRRVVFVASQHGVRLQFAAPQVELAQFQGGPAFRIPLPERLLRLQRREYYRLTAPVNDPVKCWIRLDGESLDGFEILVADISCGGIAVLSYRPDIYLQPGQVFKDCRLDLRQEGIVPVDLRIVHTFDVTLRNGSRCKRSGCQFLDLAPGVESRIQRFIVALERERNARITGLG